MVFGVHLTDGTVQPVWAAGGWAAAGVLVLVFARRVPDAEVPRVGLVTAALFVASQVHVPVGPASVHLLLNGLAGVLLGRRAVAAVAVALALQLLLFGHGGWLNYGLNLLVYALPALAAGQFAPRTTLGGAAVGGLTAGASVLLNAGVLLLGGTPGVGERRVVGLVLLAHLPVVAVEAVVTGFAVAAVQRAAGSGNTSGNGVSH